MLHSVIASPRRDGHQGQGRNHERFARRIAEQKYSLAGDDYADELPASARDIDDMFVIADWLAIHYQKRFNMMLRVIHVLAVLMGLAFIVYSDLIADRVIIFVFLVFFAIGVGMYARAQRVAWHRKYLDYRALAEGMRVQFYWSAAGVKGGEATKYTHDNFLQKQDVELGWIRNVMRVAGLHSDVEAAVEDSAGLQYSIDEWIGDADSGQLGYYKDNADRRAGLHRLTRNFGAACLAGGILVAAVLALLHSSLQPNLRNLLIVLMGVLPLIAAVRDAYAHKKADKELIKQYRFMQRIFGNARRKVDESQDDRERREILKALGDAALDEHAEWILMHRERPLEIGKL